jgi:hypothetical protein
MTENSRLVSLRLPAAQSKQRLNCFYSIKVNIYCELCFCENNKGNLLTIAAMIKMLSKVMLINNHKKIALKSK